MVKVGVGFDGSKLSDDALRFAIELVKRRGVEEDSLLALHIAAPPSKKQLVPAHLASDKLKADVGTLAGEQQAAVEWFEEERVEGMATGEMLCKLVEDSGVEFVCVGTYGRKSHDGDHYLGQTGAQPLRLMGPGCFVVKNSSRMPSAEPMKWVMSSDDSDFAMKAIADTKDLMKEGDTLTVFLPTVGTVGMRTSGSSVDAFKARKEKKYSQMCDEFVFKLKDPGEAISDTILAFAKGADPDVLVVAHKGLTYSYTQDVAEEMDKVDLGSVSTVSFRHVSGRRLVLLALASPAIPSG
jgi:nucleotide-binding universal stress UspA family protein